MTTWEFGGTDLSTFGNITLIDDYLDLPERRGKNQVLPFRHGTVFVQKFYDERVISFGIAVMEADSATLETTLASMRGLFAVRTEQTLAMTLPDTSVRNAQACVDSPMQVRRIAPNVAKVVVNFTLSKPFFRLSTAIADNTVIVDESPQAMTVTNPGTVEERDPIITLTGPLENTVITNSTNGIVLTYTGIIDGGDNVVIQTDASGEYTATHSADGNVIGNVSHTGSSALMVINIGENTLAITDDEATTGTVKISFNAPYL
jgi:phage-related protein